MTYVSKEFMYNLQFLVWSHCQQCKERFDNSGEISDQMNYFNYVKHLTKQCSGLQMDCPLQCGETLVKSHFKHHLADQLCPMFEVECVKCLQSVRVRERINHFCTISKLYARVVEKVI